MKQSVSQLVDGLKQLVDNAPFQHVQLQQADGSTKSLKERGGIMEVPEKGWQDVQVHLSYIRWVTQLGELLRQFNAAAVPVTAARSVEEEYLGRQQGLPQDVAVGQAASSLVRNAQHAPVPHPLPASVSAVQEERNQCL